ncbi:MAG: methyltransferase type 11 [Acidobacteria bacterium]|nr:MAG: methyltransferase type 11 [Acidobacteriota bacterium]
MNKTINKLGRIAFRLIARVESIFDRAFLVKDVPLSKFVSHQKWQEYLYVIGNKEGMRILEIGSREITGPSEARKRFSKAEYTGFDFYPGNNVDVVGDAHKLSSYFKKEEKFDIIYSSACFEHFAMPWLVAIEIAKLLKVGGIVFVETHFSHSSHERPWHFFQFSDMALRTLFSSALGFECIEAGMSNPMVGRFSSLADGYLRYQPIVGLFCHSEYLGKKVKDMECFDWNSVDLVDVVGETKYPEPKS